MPQKRINQFRGIVALAVAVSWLIVTPALATPPNWDRDKAIAETQTPIVGAEVDRLAALFGLLGSQEIIRELGSVATRADLSAPQRDAILYGLAMRLRTMPPDPLLTVALKWLRDYAPSTLVAHEENAAYGIPLLAVSAAAEGTSQHWSAEQTFAAVRHALQQRDPWIFTELAKVAPELSTLAGARRALTLSTAGEIADAMPALQHFAATQPLAAPLLFDAAAVIGSEEPIKWLLEQPALVAASAIALAHADGYLGIEKALPIWLDLTAPHQADHEIAAIALGQLGHALSTNPWLEPRLVDLLDHAERGGAAAMALAEGRAVGALGKRLLDATQSEISRRRAALGLRLEGSPAALAALEQSLAHKSTRIEEVAQWFE